MAGGGEALLRYPMLIAVLAAVLCAATLTAQQGPIVAECGPTEMRGAVEVTPIVFGTREFDVMRTTDAELWRLRVPQRWETGDTATLGIRWVRFPSTSPDPGPPIVYLAGGPGGSGILSAAGDRFPLFMKLREAADVIALDQRGVYGTDPYPVCPGTWSYPLDRPAELGILEEVQAPFLRDCAEHWSERIDPAAFTAWESAADIDAVRAALGAESVTLWGISYGTHLGLAYIRRYPDRVHRAILAGVEGPDHTYKLPANVNRVLVRVDSAIAADPDARAAYPDWLESLERAIERLEREPARVEVRDPEGAAHTVVLGPTDLRLAVYWELGEREDIVELPARLAPVLAGDYGGLARLIAGSRLNDRESAMAISVDCASGATEARLRRIEDQAPRATLGEVFNLSLRAECANWPVHDLGDDYRGPIESEAAVLFISGTLDSKTPPSNAEEVRRGFPDGRHLVIDGGSHDDDLFLSSPRIGELMLEFLRGAMLDDDRLVLPPLRFVVRRR